MDTQWTLDMDPASIIGTTSAVLSFVDFVWKAASTAKEIYDSATDSREEDDRLRELTSALDPAINKLQARLQQKGRLAEEEKSALRVAEQCRKVGGMLLELLRKQQLEPSAAKNGAGGRPLAATVKQKFARVANAAKVTIVVLWNKKECEDLRNEFNMCTIQLNTHLLVLSRLTPHPTSQVSFRTPVSEEVLSEP